MTILEIAIGAALGILIADCIIAIANFFEEK
jgi:hypothetical protein